MTRAVSASELNELFEGLSNWGRWGKDDQRGALNLITPDSTIRAVALVESGESVSCALPLNTQGSTANPNPVVHTMIRGGDLENATFSADRLEISSHGLAHTHLDALCHVFYRGQMYNGQPAAQVTSGGALANTIEAADEGITARGVLFDMPKVLGKQWLEPGEAIYTPELERAESEAGVRLEPGDVLLVRTGRHEREAALGAEGSPGLLAGLHATTLPWLREKDVAVLGCDGVSDVWPSGLAGEGSPIHTVIIAAMGVHLLDNAQLDDLAGACQRHNRWQFLLSMAPLRLKGGTASPVNPIAVF